MNLNEVKTLIENDFDNIEIIKKEDSFFLYHATSLNSARNILENGFKGVLEDLHGSFGSPLLDDPDSIVFASDFASNQYGNTILEIEVKEAIKATNTWTDEVEYLIQVGSIINVSEYCGEFHHYSEELGY